jgi:hypothetical protein
LRIRRKTGIFHLSFYGVDYNGIGEIALHRVICQQRFNWYINEEIPDSLLNPFYDNGSCRPGSDMSVRWLVRRLPRRKQYAGSCLLNENKFLLRL